MVVASVMKRVDAPTLDTRRTAGGRLLAIHPIFTHNTSSRKYLCPMSLGLWRPMSSSSYVFRIVAYLCPMSLGLWRPMSLGLWRPMSLGLWRTYVLCLQVSIVSYVFRIV